MSVTYQNRDGVALISIARPPVNSIDTATRRALAETLQTAFTDADVIAIVISGTDQVFSAGADIDEFANGHALDAPMLPEVLEIIERGAKPVVAAIAGNCLGAGLELALACHFRIAKPGAKLGFPEIHLGLLPGAGTQRLPRAIGVEAALRMILSGIPVSSEEAQQDGLLVLAQGDLLAAAVALAKQAADNGSLPRLRDRKAWLPSGTSSEDFFTAQSVALRTRLPAPLKCIEAVRATLELPFEQGLRLELALFLQLLDSTESKGLRHAFFSERAAAHIPDLAAATRLREIRHVAVIGAGTMGIGIAMCCANAGLPVTLVDMQQDALNRGLATIRKNYDNTAKKGNLTADQIAQRMALIHTTTAYADICHTDMVIEAVFEDYKVKEQVFRALDEVLKPGAILASNTSTLDVNRIAGFTKRPQDVVGTHFFSPANVMRLLEVIRAEQTSGEVLATTMAFAKRIRKVGVVSGVCDGFIGNRMLEEYLRQAYFLLEIGATPVQVDRALQKWGMAMGPFAMIDLAGGDIAFAIRARRALEQPDRPYSKFPDQLYHLGRYGQKTNAGFYVYEPGKRAPIADPGVDQMVEAFSEKLGIKRRAVSDEEIVSRCILALANEGAKILEEGIAARAGDIDTVYLNGYGFPSYRGGPMFYADTLGLDRVVATMETYMQDYQGQFWQPSALLKRLAGKGKTLCGAV